jgi:hypothetical protein
VDTHEHAAPREVAEAGHLESHPNPAVLRLADAEVDEVRRLPLVRREVELAGDGRAVHQETLADAAVGPLA